MDETQDTSTPNPPAEPWTDPTAAQAPAPVAAVPQATPQPQLTPPAQQPPAQAPPYQSAPPQQPPPQDPRPKAPAPPDQAPPPRPERDKNRRTVGIVLIAIGAVFLVNQFIQWEIFWPVLLIGLGVFFLLRR